ncbi:hypothetical protein MMPV_006213 [Pyropia vietnamensis]
MATTLFGGYWAVTLVSSQSPLGTAAVGAKADADTTVTGARLRLDAVGTTDSASGGGAAAENDAVTGWLEVASPHSAAATTLVAMTIRDGGGPRSGVLSIGTKSSAGDLQSALVLSPPTAPMRRVLSFALAPAPNGEWVAAGPTGTDDRDGGGDGDGDGGWYALVMSSDASRWTLSLSGGWTGSDPPLLLSAVGVPLSMREGTWWTRAVRKWGSSVGLVVAVVGSRLVSAAIRRGGARPSGTRSGAAVAAEQKRR